jgi:HSP20 family protein
MRYRSVPELEDFPATFRAFQDTVNRFLAEPTGIRPWSPAVDIFETQDELVLRADLPGTQPREVAIQIENGTLTLKGERKFENAENSKGYHRIERGYGTFARSFTLPDTVDAEKVKAEFSAGVLTITLPKKEVAKPRAIQVEVKSL